MSAKTEWPHPDILLQWPLHTMIAAQVCPMLLESQDSNSSYEQSRIKKKAAFYAARWRDSQGSAVCSGATLWALLVPAQRSTASTLPSQLTLPPLTFSFPAAAEAAGQWSLALGGRRPVPQADAWKQDLRLGASVQTSVHCYSMAYDKSHGSGNNAKTFDFFSFPSTVSLQAK